jgi:hypothetical protein
MVQQQAEKDVESTIEVLLLHNHFSVPRNLRLHKPESPFSTGVMQLEEEKLARDECSSRQQGKHRT